MVRKWLTLDGDILEESEWALKPIDRCFYCDTPLALGTAYCSASLDHEHDWVTIVAPPTSLRR